MVKAQGQKCAHEVAKYYEMFEEMIWVIRKYFFTNLSHYPRHIQITILSTYSHEHGIMTSMVN